MEDVHREKGAADRQCLCVCIEAMQTTYRKYTVPTTLLSVRSTLAITGENQPFLYITLIKRDMDPSELRMEYVTFQVTPITTASPMIWPPRMKIVPSKG